MAYPVLRTPSVRHAASPMARSTWCGAPIGGRVVFKRVEAGHYDGAVTCKRCLRYMSIRPAGKVADVAAEMIYGKEIARRQALVLASSAAEMIYGNGSPPLDVIHWKPAAHPLDRACYGTRIWQCKLAPESQASVGFYRNRDAFTVVVDERPTGLLGKVLTVLGKEAAGRAIGAAIMEHLEKEGNL